MKPSREQTNEFLQDMMSTKQRMSEISIEATPTDAVIEVAVSLILCCIIFTGLGLLYWYQENDGTDTGVGCIDDCLELEERK